MAERKRKEGSSKVDALYQWISYDLQRMKSELMRELQLSSVQVGSLYKEMKEENKKSSDMISQEIRYGYRQNQGVYDGLSTIINEEVSAKLDTMEEKVSSMDQLQELINEIGEIKYGYQQLRTAYEELNASLADVEPKLAELSEKTAKLDEISALLADVNAKLADGFGITEDDLQKVTDTVSEKTEEALNVHSQKVLDAVAAIPVAENVDYVRIVDEVGDRVLELLNELRDAEPAAAPIEIPEVDYERIIGGTTEKVVESIPYPEKVDYARIEENVTKAVVAAIDMDALASAVAAKIVIPAPIVNVPEIDYDRLADIVAAKISATSQQTYDVVLDEEGINAIADKVAEKVTIPETVVNVPEIDYDKVCIAAQAAQILPDPVDYDRIAEIVSDKISNEACEIVIDEDGIKAIAQSVSEELCNSCAVCKAAPAEETIVEEVAEETVEEPVQEVVEELVVEEVPAEAETPANEELAVATAPALPEFDGDQMIDAETGLVIRLKKSFTAKMKQSENQVKAYYSDLKNELISYKRINSNVSWHGDRFNFGRDTIAKITIVGKTLNLYLALDPNDPEYKTTVYHQKDVGSQKAYESTPFMVKVKSDAAAKKALRLIGYLAQKLAAEKEENFAAVDYAEEFCYESTKALFEAGYIKATKEKKVDLTSF